MNKAFFTGTLAMLLCVLVPLLAGQTAHREASPDASAASPDASAASPDASAASRDASAASGSVSVVGRSDQGIAPYGGEPEASKQAATTFDAAFSLPVLINGETVTMALDEYLTGVLLAELPSSFSPETRKAQAIACRTYARKRYQSRRHGSAAVCTSAACCEGWQDPQTAESAAAEKARQAVLETDGIVILYEGELIDATFFSCSGGRTEDAVAVWGSDCPYLRAVDSPGEEGAKHYEDELAISLEDFVTALKEANPAADFSGPVEDWLGAVEHTDGGGVACITLGGAEYTGRQLRKLFGLNATSFTLELKRDAAIFHTRGFGHRVGMSQYGAEAMAQAGANCVEILQHYYQGVSIQKQG